MALHECWKSCSAISYKIDYRKRLGTRTSAFSVLEVLFSHIPGLKVVCPSTPFEAKGMLAQSIEDKNPVIFFEHRWLHMTKGHVPKSFINFL